MSIHIHRFHIENFKSFRDITFYFNRELNILTGVNNSGKTTVLEALSLWYESFSKLITEAKRTEAGYKRGDYVLGPSNNRYFPFKEINSVRSPNFEDIFHERDKRAEILLELTFRDESDEELTVAFRIKASGNNYVIVLDGYGSFDHRRFNDFFQRLPQAVSLIYSTPVAQIETEEAFATDPMIREQLLFRKSDTVLRNRLYRVISGTDLQLYEQFYGDLNYVLFQSGRQIEFKADTDIRKDARAIISFRVGVSDVFKDLSLLGSGTLQVIGILLNIHLRPVSTPDLSVVLLDEPDSHIHRDIQRRLIEVFNKYGSGIQTFLTTHNESMIRSALPQQVFHLEGKPVGEIRSIQYNEEVGPLGLHFKGIMPSYLTPVMRSVGNTTGLDFINAMEADRLIFVEGEDDARVFRLLLNQQLKNQKKYMFWVLGGIGEVFENILSYKAVFSSIRNGASLWDKSVLVFDKDELSDEHRALFVKSFKDKLGIETYCPAAYTFESTLLTDLRKTASLLAKLVDRATTVAVSEQEIFEALQRNYAAHVSTLKDKFNETYFRDAYFRFRKGKADKAKILFKEDLIRLDEYAYPTYLPQYFRMVLEQQDYFKVMDKKDVETIIAQTIDPYGVTFSIETDFIELIKLVDKSTWIAEWDFLIKL